MAGQDYPLVSVKIRQIVGVEVLFESFRCVLFGYLCKGSENTDYILWLGAPKVAGILDRLPVDVCSGVVALQLDHNHGAVCIDSN